MTPAPSPQGWGRRKLGDLFRIRHGYAFKGEHFASAGPYVLLTPGNFNEGGFKDKGEKEKYYTGEVPPEYILRCGDLIIAMTEQAEGLLGSSAIVPHSGRYLHNQRLGLVTELEQEQIDKSFLYYLFNDRCVRNQIRASGGVKVRHTSPSRVYEVGVAIPPLSVQRRIAGIISAYDDLIENNTRRIGILEEMARALYREWFVHFRFPGHEKVKMVESPLGPMPHGWVVGRLDDALLLQRGFDLPIKQRREGKIPVYAATGIVGYHDEPKVKAPGVVTGRSGSLGTVLCVDEDFWPLNTALWVKEFRRVTPLYAFYLLSGLGLGAFNSGAAVPTLNRNDIQGLPVVLPPAATLEHFDKHAGSIWAMKRNLAGRTANLRTTRDLLLPKLISGEIDVSTIAEVQAEATA